MTESIAVPKATLLAVRRLLWDVGVAETTAHDQKVECFHWAAEFDHLAGMPPWPTPGEPTQKAREFYERVREHLDQMIRSLDDSR